MLRKWVPHVRTGETERTSTTVWHVVARKIQKSSAPGNICNRNAQLGEVYFGAKPCRHLYTVMHSLKMTRRGTSNQWMSWWRMRIRRLSNSVRLVHDTRTKLYWTPVREISFSFSLFRWKSWSTKARILALTGVYKNSNAAQNCANTTRKYDVKT